jgi:hypothetical protein
MLVTESTNFSFGIFQGTFELKEIHNCALFELCSIKRLVFELKQVFFSKYQQFWV